MRLPRKQTPIMPTLIEKQRELDQKRGELQAAYDAAKTEDGNGWKDITPAEQKAFIDRNAEINGLADAVKSLADMEQAAQANEDAIKAAQQPRRTFDFGTGDRQKDEAQAVLKSLGQRFIESEAYKGRKQRGRAPFAVDMTPPEAREAFVKSQNGEAGAAPSAMKTLMTTSAGLAPYPPRQAEIVPFAIRTPVVADLLPQQDTDQPSIIYLEITGWTRNAAGTAEGGQKPEDALSGTNRTVPMSKIATTLPVTEEQMDDLPGIRDFIDSALRMSVLLEEDRELLLGNGTPEVQGFLTKSGVNTGAKSTDDVFTAAHKALTAVRTVGFATPSGFVMNPTDWETIETAKDSTGRFILGDPSRETDKRLWGLPVVDTVVMTQGTILTGDFRTWSKLWRKMELRIDVGWVGSQFLLNEMTIRAEERLALQITRPAAFSLRTGY